MTFWFETHAHLADAQFDQDRADVINQALEAGVQKFIEIADAPSEWNKAQSLADQFQPHVFWAAGLHPYYADQCSDQVLNELTQISAHPYFVAIGEIGLDYAKSSISPEIQKSAFHRLFSLAIELNKPVVIHCRNAFHDLIPILKNLVQTPNPGVIHCFTGSIDDAQSLLNLGFYLGIDAPISYPSAKGLREALKAVPLDRLVLETDSPYLPPQAFRGQRNEPKYIPLIAQELATLKQTSVEVVKQVCFENSVRLYRMTAV